MRPKNQKDYLARIINILVDLKESNPDIEITKHLILATSDFNNFEMSDKELYESLVKHKTEMDINTLSQKDLEKVLEDTDEIFSEVDELDTYNFKIDDEWIAGIDD